MTFCPPHPPQAHPTRVHNARFYPLNNHLLINIRAQAITRQIVWICQWRCRDRLIYSLKYSWNSKVLENQEVIPNVQCPGCPWDHPPPIPTIPFSWSRWGRECLAKCCQNAGISKTFLEDLSKMLWGPTKVIIYHQKVIIPPKKCALIPQNRSINHLTTLIILKKYLRHFVEKCRFRWVGQTNFANSSILGTFRQAIPPLVARV